MCRRCTDEPLYRLKGKQVGILYDLVTVIREYTSKRRTEQCFVWEGGSDARIYQPGDLPIIWYSTLNG